MRSVRLALGLTLLFVSPSIVFATPIGMFRSVHTDVEVWEDDAWFTVKVADGSTGERALARIAENDDLENAVVEVYARRHNLLLLSLPGPTPLFRSALSILADSPDIAFALPAVRTHDGVRLGLSRRVLVSTVANGEVRRNALAAIASIHGARLEEALPWERGWVLAIDSPTAEDIFALCRAARALDGVVDAHPDFVRLKPRRLVLNDMHIDDQWHLHNSGQGGSADADIDAFEAWDYTTGSSEVIVAVIDDGFDLSHPELNAAGKLAPGQYDFGSGDDDPGAEWGNDHGTAVAGIAIAVGDNGQGVAGVCPHCRFLPIRQGWTDYDDVQAFATVADAGAHVVNNSWGYYYPSISVQNAIQSAIQNGRQGRGTMVVFASGNEGMSIDAVQDISAIPGVVAVGSSTGWGEKSSYSNWGASLVLNAPVDGITGIVTTDRSGWDGYSDQDYTWSFGGTSAASPIVAGVAGLVFSINPELTQAQAVGILTTTTDKIGSGYDAQGHSEEVGYGRVNAHKAVTSALGIEAEDPPVVGTPPPGATDCLNACGGESPNGCYCDSNCLEYDDCCPDACTTCGVCASGEEQPSGGEEESKPPPDEETKLPEGGDGSCSDYFACYQACTGEGGTCATACAATTSVEGLAWIDALVGCLSASGCYDLGGGQAFDLCVEQNCLLEWEGCFDIDKDVTPSTSCAGGCGKQPLGGCQCDPNCVTYGDCCPDSCSLCGICGGPSDESSPTTTPEGSARTGTTGSASSPGGSSNPPATTGPAAAPTSASGGFYVGNPDAQSGRAKTIKMVDVGCSHLAGAEPRMPPWFLLLLLFAGLSVFRSIRARAGTVHAQPTAAFTLCEVWRVAGAERHRGCFPGAGSASVQIREMQKGDG